MVGGKVKLEDIVLVEEYVKGCVMNYLSTLDHFMLMHTRSKTLTKYVNQKGGVAKTTHSKCGNLKKYVILIKKSQNQLKNSYNYGII